jgi:hypothetical protein
VRRGEVEAVMNPDESFAVANDASGLADMLGEHSAFADVVEAAAAAVAAALASEIVGTGAEEMVAEVVELVGCKSADSAHMRIHSEEVEV